MLAWFEGRESCDEEAMIAEVMAKVMAEVKVVISDRAGKERPSHVNATHEEGARIEHEISEKVLFK